MQLKERPRQWRDYSVVVVICSFPLVRTTYANSLALAVEACHLSRRAASFSESLILSQFLQAPCLLSVVTWVEVSNRRLAEVQEEVSFCSVSGRCNRRGSMFTWNNNVLPGTSRIAILSTAMLWVIDVNSATTVLLQASSGAPTALLCLRFASSRFFAC